MLASKQHDLKRAQAEASEAVQLSRTLKDMDVLSGSLNDYGNVQLSVADYAGAITTYNEVLSLQQARFGSQHVLVAATHAALSRAYRHVGDLTHAQEQVQAALAIDAAVLPPDDWRHALHLNALMMLQLEKRDYRAGLVTAQESLRIKRIALGEDHPDTLSEINNVGMAELHLEDYSAAVPLLRESLQRTETKFGERHYETAVSRINFGYAAAMSGAFGEGETQLRRGIADLHAVADPDPAEEASAIERLIRLELDQHNTHAALALFDPLTAAIAHITPAEASWDARLATVRGMTYLDSGDVAAARAQFSIADTAATQSPQTDAELRVEILLLEAKAAFAAKDMQAAKSLTGQAADAVAALSDIPTHLSTLAAQVRGLAQVQNLK
jgi:tetratricopeptide (TPR) repeat protein